MINLKIDDLLKIKQFILILSLNDVLLFHYSLEPGDNSIWALSSCLSTFQTQWIYHKKSPTILCINLFHGCFHQFHCSFWGEWTLYTSWVWPSCITSRLIYNQPKIFLGQLIFSLSFLAMKHLPLSQHFLNDITFCLNFSSIHLQSDLLVVSSD